MLRHRRSEFSPVMNPCSNLGRPAAKASPLPDRPAHAAYGDTADLQGLYCVHESKIIRGSTRFSYILPGQQDIWTRDVWWRAHSQRQWRGIAAPDRLGRRHRPRHGQPALHQGSRATMIAPPLPLRAHWRGGDAWPRCKPFELVSMNAVRYSSAHGQALLRTGVCRRCCIL